MLVKRTTAVVETLSAADLALCVHGPWHADAGVTSDQPLWDPRVETARLRGLWQQHAVEIRRASRRPWVEARLQFVDMLQGIGQ
jgi:hypothetical protein